MKTKSNLIVSLIFVAALATTLARSTAAEQVHNPIAPLARAFNALVDTLAESDPTFMERFLKKLEATEK